MSKWTLKEKSVGDLEVTIDGEVWSKAVAKAFDKLAKNLEVNGFRKGSAPKALAEKRIPMAQRQYQAIDDNANDWMRKALEENNLNPISQPQLDVKDVDDSHADLVFTFAVYPEVSLDNLDDLSYEVEAVEVKDEDVNAEIERMREQYADLETIDGAASNGDIVNIDYEGFKDGVAFDGGKADAYDLTLGSGSFIPGFEDQLVGAKAGEEKEVNVTFPEDYHAEELKGAPVVFKVKVNEVKHKVLPELNDAFVEDTNIKDVKTVDELRAYIRNRQETQAKQQAESKADDAFMESFASHVKADIPDALVEEDVQAQIQQLASQMQQYGLTLTSYLQMMGKTAEDLKNDYTEQSRKNVTARLGLEAYAKQANVEASEEDVEKEFANIAQQYNMEVDRVKQLVNVDLLKRDIVNQKAYDLLKEAAKKTAESK